MKEVTKMSRLTGQLEKAFRLLNEHFFDGALPAPVITVTPTPRAYAHYTTYDAWKTQGEGRREINIASGTLDRPIENVLASMLHEMVHMYDDVILQTKDTSNGGQYHNKTFRREAEAHGLTVTRSDRYGWSRTEPGDELLEFVLLHDELREIEMCRVDYSSFTPGIGAHTGNSSDFPPVTATKTHHRKYTCPCCGNSVRATKAVNILCLDCMQPMVTL